MTMILALNCDAWRSLWYLCMFSFFFFFFYFANTACSLFSFQCLEHHSCSTLQCHSFITIFYVNRGQKSTSVYTRLGYLQNKQLKFRVSPTHQRYKLSCQTALKSCFHFFTLYVVLFHSLYFNMVSKLFSSNLQWSS